MVEAGTPFGSCCEELKEALEGGDDFEPLITVGSNEVIYITIGLFESTGDVGPALVDHPLFFCPFCGTKLQTPEEVEAKGASDSEGEAKPRQA